MYGRREAHPVFRARPTPPKSRCRPSFKDSGAPFGRSKRPLHRNRSSLRSQTPASGESIRLDTLRAPRPAAVARRLRARDNRGWSPPTSTAGRRSIATTRCAAMNARWSGTRADPCSRVLALWRQRCQARSAAAAAAMRRSGGDARALLDGAARQRSCAHRSNTAGATASSASAEGSPKGPRSIACLIASAPGTRRTPPAASEARAAAANPRGTLRRGDRHASRTPVRAAGADNPVDLA